MEEEPALAGVRTFSPPPDSIGFSRWSFNYFSVGNPGATVTMEDYANAIKVIGPRHCILSSCGGQGWMPIHTFAWLALFRGMQENGLTDQELDLLAKTNPAHLLGFE